MNYYDVVKKKALGELEMLEKNSCVQEMVNQTLHDEDEETDYEGWIRGCKKFAEDNHDLLKEWIN